MYVRETSQSTWWPVEFVHPPKPASWSLSGAVESSNVSSSLHSSIPEMSWVGSSGTSKWWQHSVVTLTLVFCCEREWGDTRVCNRSRENKHASTHSHNGPLGGNRRGVWRGGAW